jgi:hypothetical protein
MEGGFEIFVLYFDWALIYDTMILYSCSYDAPLLFALSEGCMDGWAVE